MRWYSLSREDEMTADPTFSSGEKWRDRADTTASRFWARAQSLRWVLRQTGSFKNEDGAVDADQTQI